MNKTIIMSPYSRDVSGTIELTSYNKGIRIRVNINHGNFSENAFFKLYALSTSRAGNNPLFAGLYEITGTATIINCEISSDTAEKNGYLISDIDTYLLTSCEEEREEPVGAGFLGLEWNASRFLKKVQKNNDNVILNDPSPDSPMENGKKLLKKMKSKNILSDERLDTFMAQLRKVISKCPRFDDFDEGNFKWYKISEDNMLTNLSSVRHIVANPVAISSVKASGYFIAGINQNNNRSIAIGIPACRHICPMPQISDCCQYANGYHITGIYFDNDGQYFEKHLQNLD